MTLTDIIASYAAVLSTLTFIYQLISNAKRIKVSLIPGLKSKDPVPYGVINVINTGNKTIYVKHLGIAYPYKASSPWENLKYLANHRKSPKRFSYIHAEFQDGVELQVPCNIEPGNSIQVWIPADKFPESSFAAGKVAAYMQDALGENHYSGDFLMSFIGNASKKCSDSNINRIEV